MRNDVTVHRVVKDHKRKGQYIESHSHPFYHYIFGLGGHARVVAGENELAMKSGTLVMIPSGMEHAIYSLDTSCSLNIKFTCGTDMEKQINAYPLRLEQLGDYEKELLKIVFEEAVGGQENCDEMINVRVYELLILLGRAFSQSCAGWKTVCLPPESSKDERMARALEIIKSHLEGQLRVADVAAACGYSENYFTAFFKERAGCAPKRYINLQKIAHAKDLMLGSGLNVTEIARRLGFDSVHYFSRLFKQVTGMPPSSYLLRTKYDQGINLIHNQNTPAGAYEIPLRDAGG